MRHFRHGLAVPAIPFVFVPVVLLFALALVIAGLFGMWKTRSRCQ